MSLKTILIIFMVFSTCTTNKCSRLKIGTNATGHFIYLILKHSISPGFFFWPDTEQLSKDFRSGHLFGLHYFRRSCLKKFF